jgi:hypothetical protein
MWGRGEMFNYELQIANLVPTIYYNKPWLRGDFALVNWIINGPGYFSAWTICQFVGRS